MKNDLKCHLVFRIDFAYVKLIQNNIKYTLTTKQHSMSWLSQSLSKMCITITIIVINTNGILNLGSSGNSIQLEICTHII